MTGAVRIAGAASINGTSIFSDVDLCLSRGSWTCLLGASGVGKSTILRLIAGLSDGITFDGVTKGAGQVALMAQDDRLLPWLSVLDNVLIGARLRGERPNYDRAKDVLNRVGLRDHMAKTPSALSGGQRQRAALARTLMEDRDLVLLDEPFSALDALTRAQMQELTAEVLWGRTVLIVTHDPGEAVRLGQKILVMTPQAVSEFDAPDGDIPRAVDAPEVLVAQAKLLGRLRS